MRQQLRIYTLAPGRYNEFLEVWRHDVVPLRQRHGFDVVAAWADTEADRFVWVVAHDGDFAAAEQAYYDSPERAALDPPPSAFIVAADTAFVDPVAT